ncbi:MAG: hypothetical protein KAY02_03040 [Acidovorax sp.]|jgi:hypothetical protein|nr:hypothetical protein [Acidovorax sp.]
MPEQQSTQHSAQAPRAASDPLRFPRLEQVTQPNVQTEQAAHYLNRRPQTLRGWACFEDGPLRPLRINGRLAWPVAEIRRITRAEGSANV